MASDNKQYVRDVKHKSKLKINPLKRPVVSKKFYTCHDELVLINYRGTHFFCQSAIKQVMLLKKKYLKAMIVVIDFEITFDIKYRKSITSYHIKSYDSSTSIIGINKLVFGVNTSLPADPQAWI